MENSPKGWSPKALLFASTVISVVICIPSGQGTIQYQPGVSDDGNDCNAFVGHLWYKVSSFFCCTMSTITSGIDKQHVGENKYTVWACNLWLPTVLPFGIYDTMSLLTQWLESRCAWAKRMPIYQSRWQERMTTFHDNIVGGFWQGFKKWQINSRNRPRVQVMYLPLQWMLWGSATNSLCLLTKSSSINIDVMRPLEHCATSCTTSKHDKYNELVMNTNAWQCT